MRVAQVVVVAAAAMGIWGTGMTAPAKAEEPQPGKPGLLAPDRQERLDLTNSKAVEASLTILPIRLGGKPWDRATEVVGLLLEQQGLNNIELGKAVFDPATEADLQALAASVGEFVKGRPITTEYVLYAEINGSPETGMNELRAVVVDKAGAVAWTDRLTPQDEAFKALQSREPMSLFVLLVQRLSPQLGLNEQTAKAAKPGKMAAIMDQRSGLPPQNERSPLPGRQEEMKNAMPQATLAVFPVRVQMADNAAEAGSAAELAKAINDAGLSQATPAKQPLLLQASQADPNELRILWDLAHEFRDYVTKHPTDADYVLYADYRFRPQLWQEGFVHFIVCDRKGEWVIVDMQNSHHPDYQSIKPTSREGCDKLLLKRLEGYLR